jgi:DNA-directed RNA polymerase specialized sigma24 family protein
MPQTFTTDQIEAFGPVLSKDHFQILMEARASGNYDDMSAVLGLPKGTVKSRLHRARAALAAAIEADNEKETA